MLNLEEIVGRVPTSIREILIDRLTDIVLSSKRAEELPSSLARIILYYWQRDLLATDTGLEKLLEAAILLEPEKTYRLMEEDLGLHDLVTLLREASSKIRST
jgi:hypothetical protein